MTWSELWAYFKVSSKEIKADIWKEINLIQHLKGLDARNQILVLDNAPDEIIKMVENCLLTETKSKLGLQKTPVYSSNIITLVIK